MKYIKLFICLLTFPAILTAQETSQEATNYKWGITKTWIHLENNPTILRGVLYEIKDSSVLISNSLLRTDYLNSSFSLANINYKDLNNIYLRKKNKVLAGTIIGSATGIAITYLIVNEAANKDNIAGPMLLFGIPALTVGGGIGAFMTAFRIKIPINGNFETFKINESRLKSHSYLNEYPKGLNVYENQYEHKWFLGLTMSMSIPTGDFDERLPVNLDGNLAKTGGSAVITLGYNYKENIGLSASFINSSYNFNNNPDNWWSITTIAAGPLFSIPLREKLILDLKPMIGSANSSIAGVESSNDSGVGLAIYPSIAIRYNFSRRWCAMGESGYLVSNQKFEDGYRKLHSYNLGVGIAYRFR